MDDVVGTIEQQIRADRRALDHNIQALEQRAHDAMDLRRHYSEHAGTLMAVAFGSGVLLGALSRGSRGPARLQGSVLSVVDPAGRASTHVGELVNDIIDAAVGVAGVAAVEVISDWIPGFKEQFTAGKRRF
jgi:hypothetical protein